MEQSLVSIVIPVYNVENYIKECVESIRKQTYSNLEIILVDDGSTDKSGIICDEYAKCDSRVVVLHQENQGVVCARKSGIAYATGEYLCFVDSDDYIKRDMIDFFINHIGSSDLITTGVAYINKQGNTVRMLDAIAADTYETEEKMSYLLSNVITFENRFENGILPYLWNKMYKTDMAREVIENLDEKITYGEDREFLIRYVLKAKSVKVTKECFYTYRYRENSAESSVDKHFMQNMNRLYCALENAVKGHPMEAELMRQIEMFVMHRLPSIPVHMGFRNVAQCLQYIFPYTNLLEGKRYVLYGAGKVGIDYYRQIRCHEEGQLVLWVDKHWDEITDVNEKIYPIDELGEADYDCILIAVKRKELADSIKEELLELGINEDKIWWKSPIIFNY